MVIVIIGGLHNIVDFRPWPFPMVLENRVLDKGHETKLMHLQEACYFTVKSRKQCWVAPLVNIASPC